MEGVETSVFASFNFLTSHKLPDQDWTSESMQKPIF